MKLDEVKKHLERMEKGIELFAEKQYELEFDCYSPEQRFEHSIYLEVADKLNDVYALLSYVKKPVLHEGDLEKREDGRYEIEGTDYCFRSGDRVEIWDKEDERYYLTRIEHDGDYYAVGYKGCSLDNMKVRVR